MKRLIIAVALGACFAAAPLHAGLFKNSVDLADLAELDADRLTGLKDSEFDAFLAEVRLNAARAAERRAAGSVKTAKRILDAEQLDRKAAGAEAKAAKAGADAERLTISNVEVQGAQDDLNSAKLLVKWKEQEREAREAEVSMAKSGLDLAEARRDLNRARLLSEAGLPAAEKYDLADLEKTVSKRQREMESASRKASAESSKIEKLRLEWERVTRNPAVPADGE